MTRIHFQQCCYKEAINPAAGFCGSCRTPLLRCQSFQDCGQLLEPFQPCPVCLAPELMIEPGAVVSAHVGDRLAIPLLVRNHSGPVSRAIRVLRVLKRERDQELIEVPLDWEMIDAGAEREFYLEAGPFNAGGTGKVDVLLEVATRSKEGFQEAFVFGGTLLFNVAHDRLQQVVQNINLSGAHFETGGLVKTDLSTAMPAANTVKTEQRQVVTLQRLEHPEQELGTRGYPGCKIRISRAVSFHFSAFPSEDAPGYEVGLGARGYLAFGRAERIPDAQLNPFPMDVTLRCYTQSGELDNDASMRMSRHHFDLLVLNDRLTVFVRSGKGILLNETRQQSNSLIPISDGDLVMPLDDRPEALQLCFQFANSLHGVVESVQISRTSNQRRR